MLSAARLLHSARNRHGPSPEFYLFSSALLVFLYSLIGTCCAFITSSGASTTSLSSLAPLRLTALFKVERRLREKEIATPENKLQ